MKCSQCGKVNGEGSLHCSSCGGDVSVKEMDTASAPLTQVSLNHHQGMTRRMRSFRMSPLNFLFLCAFFAILAAIFLPLFTGTDRHELSGAPLCRENLKQLGNAVMAYNQDNDEQYPPQDQWCDALYPYVKSKSIYRCPELPDALSGYAYNERLSRISFGKVRSPANLVVLFDAWGGGWNLSGGRGMIDTRHHGAANVSFEDGHCKPITDLSMLRWEP